MVFRLCLSVCEVDGYFEKPWDLYVVWYVQADLVLREFELCVLGKTHCEKSSLCFMLCISLTVTETKPLDSHYGSKYIRLYKIHFTCFGRMECEKSNIFLMLCISLAVTGTKPLDSHYGSK